MATTMEVTSVTSPLSEVQPLLHQDGLEPAAEKEEVNGASGETRAPLGGGHAGSPVRASAASSVASPGASPARVKREYAVVGSRWVSHSGLVPGACDTR